MSSMDFMTSRTTSGLDIAGALLCVVARTKAAFLPLFFFDSIVIESAREDDDDDDDLSALLPPPRVTQHL